jgi:predicted alpha-1,6-mannanase (GH76 family)
VWTERADQAQAVLAQRYANRWPWQGWPGTYRCASPVRGARRYRLNYWWQAHALDALVDAGLRSPTPDGALRVHRLVRGIRRANRYRWPNEFYDDMGWMGLALLRADPVLHAAGLPGTLDAARELHRVVQGAWNGTHGGGIPWSTRQPGYKNVPANGPAALLAVRLHHLGDPDGLDQALRIAAWTDATLVDPGTGAVWDGVGRLGDDRVDRAWRFTYTYGLVIGMHAELHAATGDPAHAERAARTVEAALRDLAPDGVLQDEGPGDGALFRGVLARHLVAAVRSGVAGGRSADAVALLERCGEAAWAARDDTGRSGPSWRGRPDGPVDLSAHLAAVLLFEALATLEPRDEDPGAAVSPG